MIVPGGDSPRQEGNDGALLLTSRNKGGGRNDRLRITVVGHYDRHACTGCNELQQGRQIEKRAAIQRELFGGSQSKRRGEALQQRHPFLLFYYTISMSPRQASLRRTARLFAASRFHKGDKQRSEPPSSANCLAAPDPSRRGEALHKRHPFLLFYPTISVKSPPLFTVYPLTFFFLSV